MWLRAMMKRWRWKGSWDWKSGDYLPGTKNMPWVKVLSVCVCAIMSINHQQSSIIPELCKSRVRTKPIPWGRCPLPPGSTSHQWELVLDKLSSVSFLWFIDFIHRVTALGRSSQSLKSGPEQQWLKTMWLLDHQSSLLWKNVARTDPGNPENM